MSTIKYTMVVAFTLAAALISWASYTPSAQDLYNSWREDAGLRLGDPHHFYLSATVLAVENGKATVHVGIGGAMQGYLLNVSGAALAGTSSDYTLVGGNRTITDAYNGFADLSLTMPVGGLASALAVTLQPNGSFDDMRSLRIYLPIEARPDVMVQAAVLDTAVPTPAVKVSCPRGCYLFSYSFPPPCSTATQYICCRTNQFVVDGTRCTIRCQNGDPCPVIVTPDPVDTVKVDTNKGSMR